MNFVVNNVWFNHLSIAGTYSLSCHLLNLLPIFGPCIVFDTLNSNGDARLMSPCFVTFAGVSLNILQSSLSIHVIPYTRHFVIYVDLLNTSSEIKKHYYGNNSISIYDYLDLNSHIYKLNTIKLNVPTHFIINWLAQRTFFASRFYWTWNKSSEVGGVSSLCLPTWKPYFLHLILKRLIE